jgi:hypothetical protein
MMVYQKDRKTEDRIVCRNAARKPTYRYGRSKSGKQRFLCLMCNRQFILNPEHIHCKNKPVCAVCGAIMYLYKRDGECMRFRCSRYPECRTYRKQDNERDAHGLLSA